MRIGKVTQVTSEFLSVGDICEFSYGASLPEAKRKTGPFPVYGSNGPVGWHSQSLTHGPTLIIGRKGSIGRVHYSSLPCFPIDTTYFIEKTKLPCSLRWLYYALNTLNLPDMNKAAAVPGLNRNDAYEKKLAVPPLAEQECVVALLDKADRLCLSRRYARQLSDTVLQTVFLKMFGDPVKNSMGWDVVLLEELGDLDRGRSKYRPRNAPHLLGGPYPLIQTGEVANSDGYIRAFKQTYSECGLRQSKMWPRGTLCITIAANIAKTGILLFDACFPDSVVGFIANQKTNTEYVQQWFSFVQQYLERTAPESAQKNINLEILRGLQVPLPPLELQKKFAAVVRCAERVRAQQREADRQAHHLFQTLLHRAFSDR